MNREYEPAEVEAERVAWLRGVYWEIRRRLEGSRPVAAWRRRVPRPLEAEALLMVVDPTDAGFQVSEVAARLGLRVEPARRMCRWGRRMGLLEEHARAWRLARDGRRWLGELEAAHAEALRPIGRGGDPRLWAEVFEALGDLAGPELRTSGRSNGARAPGRRDPDREGRSEVHSRSGPD